MIVEREKERERSEEFESTPRSDDFQERYLPWQRKELQRRGGYVGEEAHRVFLFRLFDRTYPGLHTKNEVLRARSLRIMRFACVTHEKCS